MAFCMNFLISKLTSHVYLHMGINLCVQISYLTVYWMTGLKQQLAASLQWQMYLPNGWNRTLFFTFSNTSSQTNHHYWWSLTTDLSKSDSVIGRLVDCNKQSSIIKFSRCLHSGFSVFKLSEWQSQMTNAHFQN